MLDNIDKNRQTKPSTILKDCGIDFEGLLNKFGPEGLYEIATHLREIAIDDVRDAMGINNDMHPNKQTYDTDQGINCGRSHFYDSPPISPII